MNPPVIITGMHRSGTTMLVAFLQDCGLFFGSQLDPNKEDFFFLRRNEWLLRQAGGAWDDPAPFLESIGEPARLEQMCSVLADHVDSFAFRRRRGWKAVLSGVSNETTWGWKDPRAVFTLPAWLPSFPGARLIHIRRDGVDVAASLRVREGQRQGAGSSSAKSLLRPGILDRLTDAWQGVEYRDEHLFPSRELPLSAGFELWEQYIERGEQVFDDFQGAKLALTFEELASQPAEMFQRVAEFAGAQLSQATLDAWMGKARPDRVSAWKQDAELSEFHKTVQSTQWMRALGYGDSGGA